MSFIGIIKSGLSSLNGDYHATETASVFAKTLSGRISQSTAAGGTEQANAVQTNTIRGSEEAAQGQSAKSAQLEKLESAISSSMAHMAEKHGEKAGVAMMGIISKRLGEGEINEETLGEAYLDVIRFVDKNFGIAAGDEFMAHLNGSLNDSMNDFFDNGKSELFHAVTKNTGSPVAAVKVENDGPTVAEKYANSILELLKSARNNEESESSNPYLKKEEEKGALLGVLQDIMA